MKQGWLRLEVAGSEEGPWHPPYPEEFVRLGWRPFAGGGWSPSKGWPGPDEDEEMRFKELLIRKQELLSATGALERVMTRYAEEGHLMLVLLAETKAALEAEERHLVRLGQAFVPTARFFAPRE